MTNTTKQIEEKFNKALPSISQAEPGKGKPRSFSKSRFLKAAQELQQVIKENDKHESAKT